MSVEVELTTHSRITDTDIVGIDGGVDRIIGENDAGENVDASDAKLTILSEEPFEESDSSTAANR